MKQILKVKISNRIITYFIYFLLLILVLGIWIAETRQFDEVLAYSMPYENRWDLENVIFTLKLSNLYTASLLSIVLGIGIFLRNKVGWVLVTSWFYFVFSNFVKSIIEDKMDGIMDILLLLFLLAIPSAFIYLMNKFKGIEDYHRIKGKSKLNLNLWAIGIGILLAVLRIYKRNLLQHWL
ncbi:hypothetical protein WIW50_20690 [Flavobacteriaceae bacterium 3-367]